MERLGLGEDATARREPAAWSACSVTGFGAGAAQLPGYDLLIQAVGGLMSVTGEPDGPPMKVGVALVDVIAGLFATVAILAALRERERSGLGQRVEVSLMGVAARGARQPGVRVPRRRRRSRSGWATAIRASRRTSPSPPPTARSSWRSATTASSRRCARELGLRASSPRDERFATNPARVAHREALLAALAPRFAARTRADLGGRARARPACPCGPVNDIGDAFALAESLGLGSIVEMAEGVRQVANPIALDRDARSATAARRRALGADDAAVRAWLRERTARRGPRIRD